MFPSQASLPRRPRRAETDALRARAESGLATSSGPTTPHRGTVRLRPTRLLSGDRPGSHAAKIYPMAGLPVDRVSPGYPTAAKHALLLLHPSPAEPRSFPSHLPGRRG